MSSMEIGEEVSVNGNGSSSETAGGGSQPRSLPEEEPSNSVSEMVYREQLAGLSAEMAALSEGRHPAYLEALEQLQRQLEADLEEAQLTYDLEMERIQADREAEARRGEEELAERKAEVVEALVSELEERRKAIDAEHAALDLGGESLETKSLSTRKLRRRPNEPPPREDRRNNRRPPPHVSLLLPDTVLNHDLALIANKTPPSLPPGDEEGGTSSSSQEEKRRQCLCPGDPGAILENGRLHYENKHYLRGQTVYVETSDLPKIPAVIQHVGDFDISLKSLGDGKRISINLWELRDGRAVLRKRTA